MSHEIRTPLNAIMGYAQILRRKPGLPVDERAAVNTIEASGDHLLTLIDSVLDFSKIEAGRMELQAVDFDLTQLIQEVAAMFQGRCQEKGLQWRVEWTDQSPRSKVQGPKSEAESEAEGEFTAEDAKIAAQESGKELTTDHTDSTDEGKTGNTSYPCPSVSSVVKSSEASPRSLRLTSELVSIPVHADEGKLRQVLINLLGNAVKFTEHGEVVLRIERSHQSSASGGGASLITDH